MEMILDFISIRTDGLAAQDDDFSMNLIVADTNETFYVTRQKGVLLYCEGEKKEDADATVTCNRLQLFAALMGQSTQEIQIEGDQTVLEKLLEYTEEPSATFNVIEP